MLQVIIKIALDNDNSLRDAYSFKGRNELSRNYLTNIIH